MLNAIVLSVVYNNNDNNNCMANNKVLI